MYRKKGKLKKTMLQHIIGIFLSAVMIFNIMSAGVLALYASEEYTGTVDGANVSMALMTGDVILSLDNRDVRFTADECGDNCQGHIITQNVQGGMLQGATIIVESGTHNVTFSDLYITSAYVGVMPGGTMNLTLQGNNKIKGFESGIYVPVGATLVFTAESTGSLDASGEHSAGIGGAFYDYNGNKGNLSCGTVVINGGNITATGGDMSAGIGGAFGEGSPIGNGGNVTITGGKVTANGSKTQWGNAPDIGGGYNAVSNGSLTLSSPNVLDTSTTLESDGEYYIISPLTSDMISVPEDMHYTSSDMTEEIKAKVALSGNETIICGQKFKVDNRGWILSVTKKSDLEYTAVYTHEEKGTISKPVIILPCIHNNGAALTRHEEVEANCMHTGVMEYWECSVCNKKFSDEDGQTEITDIEIPIAAHILTYYKSEEANCTQAGNVEYWDCSVCNKKFSDKDGQTEIADADIVIPVKGHTLDYHARKEAGCLTEGNIEYWSCNVCHKLFIDSNGHKEVTDIKIPEKGHEYGAWESNGNGTHSHSCQMSGCGFTETKDCSGGDASYTEKAICEICKGQYGEFLNDTVAPTGEIIIGTNKWNRFLNTITFGLFFKKTEQITITTIDKESGIASVAYYISGSEMSEEEVKKLDNWIDGNKDKTTLNISKDESCVVYARITDNQGNVTYISSDGLVFDGTPPAITGITDGQTYCTPQTVTVTDENLASVIVNGKDETLLNNKFILDIESNVKNIVIEASDKAGNITTITVKTEHIYGTEWKSDSNSHWKECTCGDRSEETAHTEDSGIVTKPATETETGIMTYKCSVCDYVMRTEEIEKLPPSHTHSYGTEWKSDSDSHWHECDCGDKTEVTAHTEDSGSVTKPATETETGIMTYKCSVCDYVMRTEEIEKLPPSNDESSQPGDNKPETGKPFIKDEFGKEGWNIIKEETEKTENGKIITVDMNGSNIVPGDMLDNIRGRDITIVFDMGNNITWSVNGKNIKEGKISDIDFSVNTNMEKIPADIVNNIIGEKHSIQISLAHQGEFGFKAELSINLGKENAGLTASLYNYIESTGTLQFICTNTVAEDGTASFAFTHVSDYVVVIDRNKEEIGTVTNPTQPKETEGTTKKNATTEKSPNTGEARKPWWFTMVGALVIVMVTGVFLVRKEENER